MDKGQKNMKEIVEIETVMLTIKKEKLELDEAVISGQNADTKCGIIEPKIEKQTFEYFKQEMHEYCDEKITIDFGIINKDDTQDYLQTYVTRNTEEKIAKCEFCPKRFARKVALLEHSLQHKWSTKNCTFRRDLRAPTLVEEEIQGTALHDDDHATKPDTNYFPLPCPRCPKRWRTKDELAQHVRCHSEVRPFVCCQCGKGFKHRGGLYAHAVAHSSDLPYFCDRCHKRFKCKRYLKRHEPIHNAEAPYACATCGKRFKQSETLASHNRRCSGLERPFKCDACEKCYLSKANLAVHKRIHADDTPYVCQVCGARFVHRNSFLGHRDAHSEEKKYACGFCEERFKGKQGLLAHTRDLHI